MNTRKVEWHEGDCWRQVKAKISFSRNGNMTFQHQCKRYVFKNYLAGTEVLVLQGNKWIKAGRVDKYGTIFLGLGESYSEMIERKNKGKTTEQLITELRDFMKPECASLDRAEQTINSLKNARMLPL